MSGESAVLHANIIVRLLVDDDPNLYGEACAIMAEIQAGTRRAVLREPGFAESVFVLRSVYGISRQEVIQGLDPLLSYDG